MDEMNYTPEQLLIRMPILLEALINSTPYGLGNLTQQSIRKLLKVGGSVGGVYLFSSKEETKHLYVGRSANLAQRVGENHRSTAPNRATVSKSVLNSDDYPGVKTMEEARKFLYEKCVVRLMIEEDVCSRAIFEVYTSMVLKTPFNNFIEH